MNILISWMTCDEADGDYGNGTEVYTYMTKKNRQSTGSQAGRQNVGGLQAESPRGPNQGGGSQAGSPRGPNQGGGSQAESPRGPNQGGGSQAGSPRGPNQDGSAQAGNLQGSNSQERITAPKIEGPLLNYRAWIFMSFFFSFLISCIYYADKTMPEVVPNTPNTTIVFSEQRAREFLQKLVNLGPRPSGSVACDVKAVDLIVENIERLKNKIDKKHLKRRLDLSIQHPSGCYNLNFLSDFSLCYHNVTNVVARLGDPKNNMSKTKALLINCHFDTLPDTPGATDDAVSCAIMMEILEVLVNSKTPLLHDIIFLFNGAEENFLQGSHGFITQHEWKNSIRAFINLEGTGSGGRELLFQSGPGDSWILETYLRHAPYPHCSIIAQEIFQTNIIPSDTDFRIFRDFGNLSGLDIAYTRKGYVYHTEFDTIDFIESGAIQRAGENLLAVTRAIIASPNMDKPRNSSRDREWVFFDFVGLFPVFFPMRTLKIANTILTISVMLYFYCAIMENTYDIEWTTFKTCTALAFGYISGIFISYIMYIMDKNMIWYSSQALIIVVYLCPILANMLEVHVNDHHSQTPRMNANRIKREKNQYDFVLLVMTIFMIIMTSYNLGSSFFFTTHVFFLRLRQTIIGRGKIKSPFGIFITQIICMIIPAIITCYAYLILIEFFVPLMGRIGNTIDSDSVMMSLAFVFAAFVYLHIANLVYLTRSMKYLLLLYGSLCALVFFNILFNPTIRPYKYEKEDLPRLRRVIALDTTRRYIDFYSKINTTDNGMFILTFDNRKVEDLPKHAFLGMHSKHFGEPPKCNLIESSYCRLPYYTAFYQMLPPQHTRYVRTAFPAPAVVPLSMKIQEHSAPGRIAVFMINLTGGSDKIALHITPLNNYKLKDWSFTKIDELKVKNTYFVFLTHGRKSSGNSYKFTLFFAIPSKDFHRKESAFEISATAFYTHGPRQNSDAIAHLRNSIQQRRLQPENSVDEWRWSMTLIGGVAEVLTIREHPNSNGTMES